MNYPQNRFSGFVPDVIEPDHYLFGQELPVEILQADADWSPYLPTAEPQSNDFFDTNNCVTFTILNDLETLERRKYGTAPNWSDRYAGIMAGTTIRGNSPQNVIETIRTKSGLIPEAELPFSPDIQSFDEYYSPNPMTPSLVSEGVNWLDENEIKHDWVATDQAAKDDVLEQALKSSPLSCGVGQWYDRGDGVYTFDDSTPVHYAMYFARKPGEYRLFFDQYYPFIKKVDWNAPLRFVKRYSFRKRTAKEIEDMKKLKTLQFSVIGLLKQLLTILMQKVASLNS